MFMKKIFIFVFSAVVLCSFAAPKPQQDAELFEAKEKNMKRFANVLPPNVKTIACIAPGSYPGTKHHKLGVELLRQAGYKVKVMPHTFVRQKDKAQAPLEGRLADFYAAWNDPEVDMIFCVRGGVGSEELLDNIDWSKLKKRPELYFQGYSDITLINCALVAKNYGHPITGPMAGSLSGLPRSGIEAMRKIYHNKTLGPVKLEVLKKGDFQGKAFAGLLQRFAIATTKYYRPDNRGKVIFIECVNLSAAKVRENLETLYNAKFFDGAAGVVFCKFARCKPANEVQSIIREFAAKLNIPSAIGFPYGHVALNYCIDYQRTAIVKDGTVTFPALKK